MKAISFIVRLSVDGPRCASQFHVSGTHRLQALLVVLCLGVVAFNAFGFWTTNGLITESRVALSQTQSVRSCSILVYLALIIQLIDGFLSHETALSVAMELAAQFQLENSTVSLNITLPSEYSNLNAVAQGLSRRAGSQWMQDQMNFSLQIGPASAKIYFLTSHHIIVYFSESPRYLPPLCALALLLDKSG